MKILKSWKNFNENVTENVNVNENIRPLYNIAADIQSDWGKY